MGGWIDNDDGLMILLLLMMIIIIWQLLLDQPLSELIPAIAKHQPPLPILYKSLSGSWLTAPSL